MSIIRKLNQWANAHTSYYIDLLRVLVGTYIVYKGFSFLADTNNYDLYGKPLEGIGLNMIIIHTVVGFNIVGGVMIIVGLLTRWAIFSQLPILTGAVLMNFIGEYNLNALLLSITILLICLFFLFFGSGKHSADYYFKMQA